MSKLDSFPQPPRAQGRTAHDMSHDFKFTCNNGQLLPVEHDWLIPGDTAYLKFHFFGRNLLDFLAPAMCDIDFHVDYFFVPAMLIYTPFGSFERGVKDEFSSFYLARDTSTGNRLGHSVIKLPILDMKQVNDYFWRDARSFVYHFSDPDTGQSGAQIPGEQLQYEALGRQYVRLMDMLGFNGQLDSQVGFNPNVFPYALCSYQCIYEKYFRLDDREDYSPIFNLDKFANVMSDAGLIHLYSNPKVQNQEQQLKNLFRLRYRPANFDYFNSVKKSPLLNDQNLNYNQQLSIDNIPQFKDAPSWFGEYESYPVTNSGYVGGINSPSNTANSGSITNLFGTGSLNNSDAGLAQLRQMFAVDKVAQVTARARKSYDAQVLAHFGYKVPHDVKHDLTHIAHESETMKIGQVISTGSVEDLGARAGNGVVSHESKGIKFTAPCHGCLMVIFSTSVRYDYQVPFLRKNFIQSRLDFWQPEFDHLGMQPTYMFETNYLGYDGFRLASDCAFDVQGWTYRYSEKKRNINRVSLAFGHDPWPASDLAQTLSSYAPWQRPYHGVTFGHYLSDPGDPTSWTEGNYQYASDEFAFLSRPSDLDGIFSAIYDTSFPSEFPTNIGDLFVRDQFIIASRVQYTKVSEMSAYSMPKLD